MDVKTDLSDIIKDKNGDKIKVKLVGEDGNAFAILGACDRSMRVAGVPEDARKAFYEEATSGDYNTLLQTALKYFSVS